MSVPRRASPSSGGTLLRPWAPVVCQHGLPRISHRYLFISMLTYVEMVYVCKITCIYVYANMNKRINIRIRICSCTCLRGYFCTGGGGGHTSTVVDAYMAYTQKMAVANNYPHYTCICVHIGYIYIYIYTVYICNTGVYLKYGPRQGVRS